MLGKIASTGIAVDKMQRCTGNPSPHKRFRLPNARQSWRNRRNPSIQHDGLERGTIPESEAANSNTAGTLDVAVKLG